MKFLWPGMLWWLAAIPVLVALYVLLLRRKKQAVRYASVSLVKDALGPGHRIRRHIPPTLMLLAMLAMLLAMARPSAVITLPSNQQTLVLAVDVSLSMRASDVEPTRLIAAQAAVKSFVEELPPELRVGIVSFAGSATVVQPPTKNRDDLVAAVDRLQLQRHTATGTGLIVSLATLLPDAGIDVESLLFGRSGNGFGQERGTSLDQARKGQTEAKKEFKPVPPGSYKSGAIVLMSDGRRTTGPDPVDAAKLAADRGVRVYTIGFGTPAGGAVDFGGWSIYMKLDEEALKAVAAATGGEYYFAGTAEDLKKVYQGLNSRIVLEKKETELTAFFTAAGALLAVLAGALSISWFGRFA